MATLQLAGVSGPAGAEPHRVVNVTLSVDAGEVLAVVGPSGAGKTTLLRLIAGLEALAAGTIQLGDTRIDLLESARRRVGLVTADGALQPHLDVAANIELPLRVSGIDADERRRRVAAEAGALGLRKVLRRRPRALAAGERQAAALARETARLPAVMLLDEPLGPLDPLERQRVRRELAIYLRGLGAPTLLVTTDHAEAMSLGDRLAVLHRGVVRQVDAPQTVYDAPASAFVAGFVGDPGANLVPGRVEVGARTAQVRVGHGAWTIDPAVGPVRRLDGRDVTVGVRPEGLTLDPVTRAGVPGTVTRVERLGPKARCHVRLAGAEATVVANVLGPVPRPGARFAVVASHVGLRLFEADGEGRALI